MDYRLTTDIDAGYIASTAEFAGMECHVMLEPYDKMASASECVSCLENGLKSLLETDLNGFRPVFKDGSCQMPHVRRILFLMTAHAQHP